VARFALDQNFPQPIIEAVAEFIPEVVLVPLTEIDPLLTVEMDDWEVLLALHHHAEEWDGLITNDHHILTSPRELAVLRQTGLTLVVVQSLGHDPIRATGLLFMHLEYIGRETTPERPQVWRLVARNRPGDDPWDYIVRIAQQQGRDPNHVWNDARLTAAELAQDPLTL
jgi:hypothetical protein